MVHTGVVESTETVISSILFDFDTDIASHDLNGSTFEAKLGLVWELALSVEWRWQ